MHREYHKWYSPSLRRDMSLLAYGHAGATVIAFPTSRGTFHEWEDMHLLQSIAHRIDAGHFRLICIDCVDAESWYAWDKSVSDRAWRQCEYDGYIINEVLPFVQSRGGDRFTILAGASLGAFHALSVGLRHPSRFGRILSMSGLCDITLFTKGESAEAVHAVNPAQFVPHEHDPARLAAMRGVDIILAAGTGDRLIHENRALSGQLWRKGVGNALREWDGFAHDWPVWEQMLNLYLSGRD